MDDFVNFVCRVFVLGILAFFALGFLASCVHPYLVS